MKSPLMLIIFDGLGINPKSEGNATFLAKTPTFDELNKNFPRSQLLSHGQNVGLPEGQIGNSEVGHANMGAGKIIYQDLTRIDHLIAQGDFFKNETILKAFSTAKKNKSKLHLMGLVSDGGVHSHLNHLFALLKLAKDKGVQDVYIHCFLDGRDTSPRSSLKYLKALEKKTKEIGVGKIATLCGRYYAMDRDKRWDRVELAYKLLTEGRGNNHSSLEAAIQSSFDSKIYDEFVKPVVLNKEGLIEDNDSVLFFNFRPDRARQLTQALTEKNFSYFTRKKIPKLSSYVCFTQYDKSFGLPLAFPPVEHKHILAEVLAQNNIRQLRCAETEKYAHVTYFFNCGTEKPFNFEKRSLIDSPRDIPTYDLKPEMSAYGVTDTVIQELNSDTHDFYVVNFANPDMVGHTGDLKAAIKAVEVSDDCLGKILKVLHKKNGTALITADHGNVEQMIDYETKEPHTAHTINPVPLYLFSEELKKVKIKEGVLSDISPTLLDILKIEKPPEMTQNSLL